MAGPKPQDRNRVLLSIVQSIVVTLAIVIAVYVFGGVPIRALGARLLEASIHAPDWDQLAGASVAVRIHLFVALVALVLGAIQFALPKGTRLHRVGGCLWLLLMFIVAVSSFFLRNIRPGHFSLIHGLSVLTLIAVPWIIYTAKTGRISEHRKTVTGLYVGGLVVAGVLALLPGRVLWSVFFD